MPNATNRFAAFVTVLLEHLAHYGNQRRVSGPWLALIWNRVRAVQRQVAGLIARFEAGTLRRYPNRRAPTPPTARRQPQRRSPLPGGKLWLVRLVQETARCTPLLQDWLAHPDTAALLQAAPQLRRALRPLCNMLGVTLPTQPSPASGQTPEDSAAPNASPRRGPPIPQSPSQRRAHAPPARLRPASA